MKQAELISTLDHELVAYRQARRDHQHDVAWTHLERAHVVSQPLLRLHLGVHWLMLGFAASVGDTREVMGQALRLLLAPLGAFIGQIPLGNTGRARVNAFEAMPIPADLKHLFESASPAVCISVSSTHPTIVATPVWCGAH